MESNSVKFICFSCVSDIHVICCPCVENIIMVTQRLKELIQETVFSIPWQTQLQETLPAERVSVVLHEPAILGGYRVPHQPWKYYILSLFQFHNETVNVWTHLIGCCVILHKLYTYFDEFDLWKDTVLDTLFIFGITCLIGLFTSAMVHLVHAKSSYVHFIAFMVDYIGATYCSFGFGVAIFYGMSHKHFYEFGKNWYLTALTIASYLNFLNLCLAKIWYGHDPHNMKRKYMFIVGMTIQAVMNMAPFVPFYTDCLTDTCSMENLTYPTIITTIFILEAVTFAAHQPETTWPGKFDIVGHGHQIFHVLIVVNQVLQMNAVYTYHKRGMTQHGEPNMTAICTVMVCMYAVDILTLVFLKQYVPDCIQRVKDAERRKQH